LLVLLKHLLQVLAVGLHRFSSPHLLQIFKTDFIHLVVSSNSLIIHTIENKVLNRNYFLNIYF